MLFRLPNLTTKETEVLRQINEMKARLGLATRTPSRRWTGLLRRNSLARAIRGSNSIEGYNVTQDDAIAAAEGESPLEANEETWAAIIGYRNAMTYVLQLADDRHFQYSPQLIRSLHFMMMSYDLPRHPGSWRPGPIYVHDDERDERVYEGPAAELVPGLIDELVESLIVSSSDSSILTAAMAHLNLVMIHPFSDGNGRMARCLQALVLARDGNLDPVFCSIEEYLGKNTRDYYQVLSEVGGGAWHPKHDARPWIRFCLVAHYRQAATHLLRTQELSQLWTSIETDMGRRGLSERVITALIDAAMGYRVRNGTYRRMADVTEQTASRDLKQLVDEGLLRPVGERRGRHYVATEALRVMGREVKAKRLPIDDPFMVARNPKLPGIS